MIDYTPLIISAGLLLSFALGIIVTSALFIFGFNLIRLIKEIRDFLKEMKKQQGGRKRR